MKFTKISTAFSFLFLSGLLAEAQLSSLESHVDVLDLGFSFNPVKPAYWTSLPHHRRTPFAVSPDGKSAYLAYLDGSDTDVHIQQVDPSTFTAVGATMTVKGGKEAGGLVAQNDGFALLTNVPVTGVDNAPPDNTPVPVIVRYQNGAETWRTFVAGPGVHESAGLSMAPDMNGDLVYSPTADMYGAYFVVTDYSGPPSGHFGDSIEYVNSTGGLQSITGATSAWGCSHNTGIAFEAADQPPFASICAEDHGSIWLNTKTQTMNGVKIAGENTTNGASGEPMGGMSGSYSSLALFPDSTKYIFAWATRGCIDLTQDTWMGSGFTQCSPRSMNHNVAIAMLTDKETLSGPQAISTVGAASGDDQLNWLTTGEVVDHSNIHAATFSSSSPAALITWEEIAQPTCKDIAMGCSGTFTGAYYQAVDSDGTKLGDPVSSQDVYVAGDIVNIGDKLCWPYVNMDWDLSKPVQETGSTVTKMSFACISYGGGGGGEASNSTTTTATAPVNATSSASSSSAVASLLSMTSTDIVAAAAPTTTSFLSLSSSTPSQLPTAMNPINTTSSPSSPLTTTPTSVQPSSSPSAPAPISNKDASQDEATQLESLIETLLQLLGKLQSTSASPSTPSTESAGRRRHAREF
ncbi:MAG: hypothetical protein Q9227_008072 [Pyrenula ochraceoflavens]